MAPMHYTNHIIIYVVFIQNICNVFASCHLPYRESSDSTYRIVTNASLNWNNAQSYCKDCFHSNLATVLTDSDHMELTSSLDTFPLELTDDIWIGWRYYGSEPSTTYKHIWLPCTTDNCQNIDCDAHNEVSATWHNSNIYDTNQYLCGSVNDNDWDHRACSNRYDFACNAPGGAYDPPLSCGAPTQSGTKYPITSASSSAAASFTTYAMLYSTVVNGETTKEPQEREVSEDKTTTGRTIKERNTPNEKGSNEFAVIMICTAVVLCVLCFVSGGFVYCKVHKGNRKKVKDSMSIHIGNELEEDVESPLTREMVHGLSKQLDRNDAGVVAPTNVISAAVHKARHEQKRLISGLKSTMGFDKELVNEHDEYEINRRKSEDDTAGLWDEAPLTKGNDIEAPIKKVGN